MECLEHIISCYGYLGEYGSVIKYSDRYLELDKNNINVFIYKAQALLVFEKYEEALDYYDLALNCDSKNIIALTGKAYVLLKLEKDILFLEHCDRVLAVDSTNNHILFS